MTPRPKKKTQPKKKDKPAAAAKPAASGKHKSAYSPKDAKGIWVWIEHDGAALQGVSLELIAKGRDLAKSAKEPLVGLMIGDGIGDLAKEALKYGLDELVLIEDPKLKTYTIDAYTDVATQAVLDGKPNVLLIGATPDGRDLAGRIAVRTQTGLTADCTNLEMKKDDKAQLLGEVTGFGGGVAAMIACLKHRPQMATVRSGVFEPAKAGAAKGKVRRFKAKVDASKIRSEILDRHIEEGVDLTKAEKLVIGGRGLQGNTDALNELARLLDAEVGASRVATDNGWIDKERMIGQTGVVTRPKLAVVFGVSGAMQFTVGITAADTVVAVNTDKEAPIFEASDYCVVGDLHKVLPHLIKELKG